MNRGGTFWAVSAYNGVNHHRKAGNHLCRLSSSRAPSAWPAFCVCCSASRKARKLINPCPRFFKRGGGFLLVFSTGLVLDFPLVLSRFSRRAAVRPCENWSTAPGCGALFLLRASLRPRKKQTAVLLRLANFPSGRQCALVKIGALRQTQLPVSSAGRGRCVCPCSASAGPSAANKS